MILSYFPEEKRREFVGMWAEFVDSAKEEDLVVIVDIFSDRAVAVSPAFGGCDGLYSLDELDLRPDLPRAWTPKGAPTNGKKKSDDTISYDTITRADRSKMWVIDTPQDNLVYISLDGDLDKVSLVQSNPSGVDIVSLSRQEAMLAASILKEAARTNV